MKRSNFSVVLYSKLWREPTLCRGWSARLNFFWVASSATAFFFCASSLYAQTADPLAQQEARIKAAREAAERAARQDQNIVGDAPSAVPALGPIPENEAPCFKIDRVIVNGLDHRRLRWVPKHLRPYEGRCLGSGGLDHLLRSLQAAFLDRGLITTRAGLPEQDMSGGTLIVQIIPGRVSSVRTNGQDKGIGWSVASPVDTGDIVF